MPVINLDDSPPDTPPEGSDSHTSSIMGDRGRPRGRPPNIVPPSTRPPRDFATSAFQTSEKLQTLVKALNQHDATSTFAKNNVVVYSSARAFFSGQTWRILSNPGASHSSLSTGSQETVRPSTRRGDEDDEGNASGSSTERDEPSVSREGTSYEGLGLGLGVIDMRQPSILEPVRTGEGQRKNKKKNKKKKKTRGATDLKDEEEVAELLGKDDETTKHEEGLTNVEENEEMTIKLGDNHKADWEDDPERTPTLDMGDTRPESVVPYVHPRPGAPDDPLPSPFPDTHYDPKAKQPSDYSTDTQDTVSSVPEHEVTVRLPAGNAKQRKKAKKAEKKVLKRSKKEEQEALAMIAKENKENKPADPAAEAAAEQWSVDLLASFIELPLTPPYSPPVIRVNDASLVSLEMDDVLGLSFEFPFSPPPSASMQGQPEPGLDTDISYPLSRTWTLYYSYTGTPVLSPGQFPRIASTPVPGVLANLSSIAATRNQIAEDYSHGLVPLYTAATVEDLLGSWKALRRAIAYRKGRNIEPPMTAIVPGMEGLGISALPDDTNFHFFLHNVTPMWEDEMCKTGGKVMFTGPPLQVSVIYCFAIIAALSNRTILDR